MFSVKCAYFLAMQRRKQLVGEQSNSGRATTRCQGIWRMRVPHSVKIFIWKAINAVIPTERNLFYRRVTDTTLCPICEQ